MAHFVILWYGKKQPDSIMISTNMIFFPQSIYNWYLLSKLTVVPKTIFLQFEWMPNYFNFPRLMIFVSALSNLKFRQDNLGESKSKFDRIAANYLAPLSRKFTLQKIDSAKSSEKLHTIKNIHISSFRHFCREFQCDIKEIPLSLYLAQRNNVQLPLKFTIIESSKCPICTVERKFFLSCIPSRSIIWSFS